MKFYDWATWPNFFPVEFQRLPNEELVLALESDEFRVTTSPVHHLVPAIGMRIESLGSGQVVAYSCDTEPCDEVIRLAQDVDVLIHEATGATLGHTSAAQAGEIAQQAGAKKLYLIHYDPRSEDPELLLKEARHTFLGPVALAEDFMSFEF
jgi:ribonuclease Z